MFARVKRKQCPSTAIDPCFVLVEFGLKTTIDIEMTFRISHVENEPRMDWPLLSL